MFIFHSLTHPLPPNFISQIHDHHPSLTRCSVRNLSSPSSPSMELCTSTTSRAISISSHLHHRHFSTPNPSVSSSRISFLLKQTSLSGPISDLRYLCNPLLRAATFEERSRRAIQCSGEERDGVMTLEDVPLPEKNVYNETRPTTEVPQQEEESPMEEQTQGFELLDKLDIQFDPEDTSSILLFGGGALVTLWLASAIVGAIDAIPVFPKLMEVVGLSYTFWFTTRYLLFKKNRDELAAKIDEIKLQVLGSKDD